MTENTAENIPQTPTSAGNQLNSSFVSQANHARMTVARRSWWHRSDIETSLIWLYTFFSYAFLTACRQCLPVAKPFMLGALTTIDGESHVEGGFAPFNDPKMGSTYLGVLDSAFVLTYTICSFIWAHKTFAPLHMQVKILTLALLGSTLTVVLFGIGGYANVHQFAYYVFIQLLMGFMQSGAWSAVLNIYYSVFDVDEHIFIFSMWASCSAVGNILGRNIASPIGASYGWESGFFVIGVFVFLLGLTHYYVSSRILSISDRKGAMRQLQKQIQLEEERRQNAANKIEIGKSLAIDINENDSVSRQLSKTPSGKYMHLATKRIVPTDSDALNERNDTIHYEVASAEDDHFEMDNSNNNSIDGTTEKSRNNNAASPETEASAQQREGNSMMILFIFLYSIGLMFSKWMNYLMSLWLPVYLNEKVKMSEGAAGVWSSAFDVGAVFGMFFAFITNFYFKKPGCLCFLLCAMSVPVLLIYSFLVVVIPVLANAALLFILGMLFNGPYSLISTVVTMQLSVQFGANANAIISIVNGSGSAGSLCAGVFTAMISSAYGWNAVFYMLVALAAMQLAPLGYISYTELFAVSTISAATTTTTTTTTAATNTTNPSSANPSDTSTGVAASNTHYHAKGSASPALVDSLFDSNYTHQLPPLQNIIPKEEENVFTRRKSNDPINRIRQQESGSDPSSPITPSGSGATYRQRNNNNNSNSNNNNNYRQIVELTHWNSNSSNGINNSFHNSNLNDDSNESFYQKQRIGQVDADVESA